MTFNFIHFMQENNSLMIDEKNDVRIIGILTICVLLGIALVGMEWEARVCHLKIFLWTLHI